VRISKNRTAWGATLALWSVLASLVLVSGAGAQEATPEAGVISGVGFYPAVVDVKDALRGQRYEIGTVLVNDASQERTFRIQPEGEIAEWVTFATQARPETIVKEVSVPASGELPIWVYLNLPEDAASLEYEAQISYTSVPPEGTTGGVLLSIVQPITINVTGKQILDLQVGDVFANELEVGQPLRVQARLVNRSNVALTPTLVASIKTSAGQPIADDLQGRTEQLRAGQEKLVTALEWDSAGQQPGQFILEYRLLGQGQEFATGSVPFTLAPFGSLSRSGEIQSIVLDGQMSKGSIGRADVAFLNTGRIDVTSKFVGELFRDGKLVAPLESRVDLLAHPSQPVTLQVFFPIDDNGSYELVGRVTFDGAQTDEGRAEFKVGAGLPLASPLVLGGGAALAVVAGGWVFLRRRRPEAPPVRQQQAW
jgi:hypothetical protein